MENFEDEETLRILLFGVDFSDSIEYFNRSKVTDDIFIRDSFIKLGIISYAKPFMKNTGIYKECKDYRLPSSRVPDDLKWLHEMLLNYRGNFIAHSNFKTVKPNLGATVDTPKGEMRPIHFIGISFNHWFERSEEFPEEELFIDIVIELVTNLSKDIPKILTDNEVFRI